MDSITTTNVGTYITMCSSCKNSHICKYKECYEKLFAKIEKLQKEIPDGLFNLNLTCREFVTGVSVTMRDCHSETGTILLNGMNDTNAVPRAATVTPKDSF